MSVSHWSALDDPLSSRGKCRSLVLADVSAHKQGSVSVSVSIFFSQLKDVWLLVSDSRSTPEVTAGNFSLSHLLSAFPILTLNAQHPECGSCGGKFVF